MKLKIKPKTLKKDRPKSFRLPDSLIVDLEKMAKAHGISVNNLVNQILMNATEEWQKNK